MIDFVIGAGQGGCRLAKAFAEDMDIQSVYLNLAVGDFSKFDAPRNRIFVLKAGGTGRDPVYGEKVVRERFSEVDEFFGKRKEYAEAKNVVLCVGGGGGSGAGFLFPLAEKVLREKKNLLLVYTLPEQKEGIPVVPNSLKTLARVQRALVDREKASVLLVDNNVAANLYRRENGDSYWGSTNTGIVRAIKRFYQMANLENFKNYVDMASTSKAIDEKDVERVLFGNVGYVDVFEIPVERYGDIESMKGMKKRSILSGAYDLASAKRYLVASGLPQEWKDKKGVFTFISDIETQTLRAAGNTPDHTMTSYFNKRLGVAKIHVLAAGMTEPSGLNKMIRKARRDREKLESKGAAAALDLQGI